MYDLSPITFYTHTRALLEPVKLFFVIFKIRILSDWLASNRKIIEHWLRVWRLTHRTYRFKLFTSITAAIEPLNYCV